MTHHDDACCPRCGAERLDVCCPAEDALDLERYHEACAADRREAHVSAHAAQQRGWSRERWTRMYALVLSELGEREIEAVASLTWSPLR